MRINIRITSCRLPSPNSPKHKVRASFHENGRGGRKPGDIIKIHATNFEHPIMTQCSLLFHCYHIFCKTFLIGRKNIVWKSFKTFSKLQYQSKILLRIEWEHSQPLKTTQSMFPVSKQRKYEIVYFFARNRPNLR